MSDGVNEEKVEMKSDEKTQESMTGGQEATGNKISSESGDAAEQLAQQVEKWKNDYLYLRSEFELYKRNAIKERAEVGKYGAKALVNELLSVVDNFDRALSTALTPDNLEVYGQGVKMTAGELKSVLSRFGVVEVKCEGQPFDPSIHEALGAEESDSVPEGHVLRVFRSAYKLHDRVIRPAQVIVAKAKPKAN